MAVAAAAAFCLAICGLSIPSVAHADDPVRGAPCQPGQGVTVIVDFSLDGTDVDVRCAPGTYPSIAAAFQAAGFTFDSTSFVHVINGVDPEAMYGDGPWADGPEGNWGVFTSTVDGLASGDPSSQWQPEAVGVADGPVSVGQAYLIRAFATWTCTMSFMSGYDYTTATFDEDWIEYLIGWEIIDDPSELDVCLAFNPALSSLGLMGGGAVVPSEPSSTHGNADAGLAAAWLASQLGANGDVLKNDDSTTNWGTTIDAVIALASAGVGGDQISATAAVLNASGSAYVGTPDQVKSNWQYIAKMALGLEVAGLDPTNFGGRDLIADLMSALNSDGSFGSAFGNKVAFLQALAMLALARTDGGVPPQATAWMLKQQCTTGTNSGSFGWPSGCSTADADSTSLAIQALVAAGVPSDNPAVVAAEQWLKTQQDSTGGILSYGTPNTNSTGLAAQALADDASFTGPARQFIAGVQITCDQVEEHPSVLSASDVGAIAYTQDSFSTITALGFGDQLTSTQMATVQAVLGLGGPDYGTISAAGVEKDVPVVSCTTPGGGETTTPGGGETTTPGGGETTTPGGGETTTPGGGETTTPGGETSTPGGETSTTPGGGATVPGGNETTAPGAAQSTAPATLIKSDTGGTTTHSTGWFWMAPVLMILGAAVLRKSVTR